MGAAADAATPGGDAGPRGCLAPGMPGGRAILIPLGMG